MLLLVAVAVTSGGLVIAGCGSSSKSRSAGHRASAGAVAGLRYADCMRSHGVTNFPDPSSGGFGFDLASAGINQQSPAYQAAHRACVQFMPAATGPRRATESQIRAATKFAECMRTHAFPDFSDPTADPGLTPGRPTPASILVVVPGLAFHVNPSFDPNTPQVERAAAACGGWPY
jgi:hypothetical protein